MAKKGKEAKRREKKQRTGKKHLSLKPNEYYDVSGGSVTRKRKNCPRCGPGTWLGSHRGRSYCGKCGYSEIERGVAAPQEKPSKEDKPAETPRDFQEKRPEEDGSGSGTPEKKE
jgi:small subunit ribosomal protein S27Ae